MLKIKISIEGLNGDKKITDSFTNTGDAINFLSSDLSAIANDVAKRDEGVARKDGVILERN